MKVFHQLKAVLAGLLISSTVVPVATAEDIEIYTRLGANAATSNPNILFIVDTSGSMGTKSWVKPSYDSSTTYTNTKGTSCASNGIYFTDTGKLPDCSKSSDYFDRSALACDHAVVGYDALGDKITPLQDGSLLMIGTYSDQLAQYDPFKKRWRELKIGTAAERAYEVECFSDIGNTTANGNNNEFINDGGTGYSASLPANTSPAVPHPVWSGGAGNLQLFDGNYINYLNDDSLTLVEKSYLEQVKAAVEIMVRGNTRVDIGLMRFDSKNQSNGGAIQYPILDVGADRTDFFTRLKTLNDESFTPLSEVYYEALLYFGGKAADYSLLSNPGNQVTSETMMSGGKVFRSPISSTCDKNYIVLLSDGQPTKDDLNVTRKAVLTGFNGSSCSTDITSDATDDNRDASKSDTSTIDNCLDELAEWAYTKDVAEIGSLKAHDGDQHITTHTIGFELSDADAITLMKDTARKGGGDFYPAKSEAELIDIFNRIIASTLQVNTTFSSPAVSVNAFNRSTHLDNLYFTLFKPGEGNHWDGNLKKYKLSTGVDANNEKYPYISDKLGNAAVDASTGFFGKNTFSFWTTGSTADGDDVSQGGATSVLTATRNVYTFTGSYTASGGVYKPSNKVLKSTSNAVDKANASLTDVLLDTTGYPEIVTGTPYRETLLDWAAGLDALSEYGAADTYTDVRPQMGDPLHAEPALVQYGGTLTAPDMVAYVATNDGYLHAFDIDDGKELFSFIPQELLPNLQIAMENNGGKKLYGLDGSVTAWVNDADNDGKIEPGLGEHVYLYVSMRRGGRNIYALDVTYKTDPQLLWVIKGGTGAYTELGDTWSTVNVGQVKDGTTAKTVLMFGGGYDDAQDSALVRSTDSVGRTVYIADATTGQRLWSAGKDGASPIANMEYSIPARVLPLDVSGDGYIDRMYVADVGGQIFRFDIDNTNSSALTSSITGGRILDIAGTTDIDARRFYYPPDAALVDAPDGKYHGLVMSTGFRAHPLNDVIHDRIYMVKDRNTGLTSTYKTLTEADLHDATDNLAGGDGTDEAARDAEKANIAASEGWYIDLEDEANPGTWLGEKGLAEPLIIEGVALLTTYIPSQSVSTTSCVPNIGGGQIWYLDILDATPAFPSSVDKRPERHQKLLRGGIPPTPNVIITKGGEPTLCVGTECAEAEFGLGVRKTYWYEVEK